MKTIRASILAVAGVALAACGGVSDDDIRDALKEALPAQSTLNYAVGENWKATEVVTAKGAVGKGLTGSNLQYKFEKGAATPCARSAARTSATNCGILQSVVSKTTTEYDSTVTGKTDTAVGDLPGWVVIELAKQTIDEQRLYPVSGTQESSNLPVVNQANSIYTLAERNNFVVRIDGESDVGASTTLWPSHIEGGRTYTDDTGMSWAFTTATTINLTSRNVRALTGVVATNQDAAITLAELQQKCFRREPWNGSSTTNSNIVLHSDCSGQIQLVYDRKVDIGLDLKLHEEITAVTIQIQDYGVRDTLGVLQNNNVPNVPAGEIVFLYDAVETVTSYAVSDVTF
jgi:hypothetical protein